MHIFLLLCFQINKGAADDVRRGQPLCQAGSCFHMLASHHVQVKRFFLLCFFPWKISRVKTHWMKVMHLLLNQERFFIYDFRFSYSFLTPMDHTIVHFPFSLALFLQQSCSVLTLESEEDQMPLPHRNSHTVRSPELTDLS